MAKKYVVTREQLIEAAEDMNKVMGLEPQIDTSLPMEELLEVMKEAFQYVEPDDEFTMETWDIINAESNGMLEVIEIEEDEKKKAVGKREQIKKEEKVKKTKKVNKSEFKKKEKKGEDKRDTRIRCCVRVVLENKILDMNDWISEADKLYGKSNPKETRNLLRKVIQVLDELGLLEMRENGRYEFKGV